MVLVELENDFQTMELVFNGEPTKELFKQKYYGLF